MEQPGGDVGQDDPLVLRRQHAGSLGHEVHAAEDDVVGVGLAGRLLRQQEGIALEVGVLDYLFRAGSGGPAPSPSCPASAWRRGCGRQARRRCSGGIRWESVASGTFTVSSSARGLAGSSSSVLQKAECSKLGDGYDGTATGCHYPFPLSESGRSHAVRDFTLTLTPLPRGRGNFCSTA